MEGKNSDESQMKKTEDKEMSSSQHRSGFHKNSDELANSFGAEDAKTTLESLGNGDVHPLEEARHRADTPNLTNQHNDELLRLLTGEQEGESINFHQMAAEGMGWWTRRMEKLSRQEFQQFYVALGILRERTLTHLQQRLRVRDSNSGEMSTSSSSTSINGRDRRRRR
ncbi:hypothetical protein SLA2020_406220 [Shorea laevis]